MTHDAEAEAGDILRPVVDEGEVEEKTRKKLLELVNGIMEVGGDGRFSYEPLKVNDNLIVIG